MCTITLLRQPDGIRLFMNRDEAHSRAEAEAPQILASQYGVYGPLDPQGKGTWIAHNKNGYWGCLLNGYFESQANIQAMTLDVKPQKEVNTATLTSRGLILTALLSTDDPLQAMRDFDPSNYASFRLLVGNDKEFQLMQWDGENYTETKFHDQFMGKAFFLTSSSWQQKKVVQLRSELFKKWAISNLPNLDQYQNIPDYHLQSKLPLSQSPFMWRPVSATQSITALRISHQNISMEYQRITHEVPIDEPVVV